MYIKITILPLRSFVRERLPFFFFFISYSPSPLLSSDLDESYGTKRLSRVQRALDGATVTMEFAHLMISSSNTTTVGRMRNR